MKGLIIGCVIAFLLVAIAETHRGHGRPLLCFKKLCDGATNSTACKPCLKEAHHSGSVDKEVLQPCFDDAPAGCFNINTEDLNTLKSCVTNASEVVGACIA
ncbi:uncharacterized protein LOC119569870 [Penaeus monodon]|uniref:uncharacterized protein LOC119569870 n=1 Tax=Penaeus monodon TaxID=6687 RepID=UPI0018A73D32|nr:uncharacterized protein LOC119569870 [Penaeus monodon]